MPAANTQYEWKTDPTANFRAAIAQNAKTDLSLTLPPTLQGVNGNARSVLRSLTIASIQNLDWELWLWESATHAVLTGGVTAAGTNVVGRWTFAAGDGIQDVTGDYIYYIDGLDIPYFDADNSGKLHMSLVNRSAASKSANDAGAIQVKGRISQSNY